MKYLLDINVLIAFAYTNHAMHARVTHWIQDTQSDHPMARPFHTCSIVELGFIRIAPGKKGLAESLSAARTDLDRMRKSLGLDVLEDRLPGDLLPNWVRHPHQTTDGHLLQLANHHQMRFATLDEGIPGAELIPRETDFPLQVRDGNYQRYSYMTKEPRFVPFEDYTGEPGTIPGPPDPRWILDPDTGLPCVRATPGVPPITTEDVKRWLQDFP